MCHGKSDKQAEEQANEEKPFVCWDDCPDNVRACAAPAASGWPDLLFRAADLESVYGADLVDCFDTRYSATEYGWPEAGASVRLCAHPDFLMR